VENIFYLIMFMTYCKTQICLKCLSRYSEDDGKNKNNGGIMKSIKDLIVYYFCRKRQKFRLYDNLNMVIIIIISTLSQNTDIKLKTEITGPI